MATISITIPNAIANRVMDAMAYQHGYQDIVDDKPNPETKVSFCKKVMIKMVKESVKAYEANRDAEAARKLAIANAEGIDIT